jgi:hypothetical protein
MNEQKQEFFFSKKKEFAGEDGNRKDSIDYKEKGKNMIDANIVGNDICRS